jgi:uncharacterized protein (DUF1778 family)
MAASSQGKQTRLNIRASRQQKEVIARAAHLLNTTVSNFILQSAYADAQAVLADQTRFRLPDRQWKRFTEALDQPPKDIPALRKLLTEPGAFDG